jgi:hypothetical protein
MLRLVRLIRVFVQVKTLYLIVRGLMDSADTMLFICALVIFFLYLFSVFSVEMITKPLLMDGEVYSPEYVEIVTTHFADLKTTMLTFLQFVNMDSAHEMYTTLMLERPVLCIIFVPFLLIVSIALMNLVTAVLVGRALEEGHKDRVTTRTWEIKQKAKDVEKLKDLFKMLDKDGDGFVTLAELLQANMQIKLILESMCNTEDLPGLFSAIDVDDSGNIEIDEFCAGLLRYQRERNLDMMRMDKCTVRTLERLREVSKTVDRLPPLLPESSASTTAPTALPDAGKVADTSQRLSRFELGLEKVELSQQAIMKAIQSRGIIPLDA